LKALVTGGAGFIGSYLVDRLVNCGYAVRVIDDLSTGRLKNIRRYISDNEVEFVEGDVRDSSVVEKCVKEIDVVFHLASVVSVPFSFENPQFTFDVNVNGTNNLLRYCSRLKECKLVFVSSCAVYGEPEFLPVSEEHPTHPISPYAESKLAAEKFCLGFHEKQLLRAVVLRLFNVYGPRQGENDYSGVVTRFAKSCKQETPLVVHGDGNQSRDFVNVCDVVQALVRSAESEKADGEVFNIGFGEPTSINELAKTFLELSGLDLKISNEAAREGDIRQSYADTSKAKLLLGYTPKVCLRKGLYNLLFEKSICLECRS
jgi:UDP-glucose 4-epimerase